MEGETEQVKTVWAVAVAEAEGLLQSYDAMLGQGKEGAPPHPMVVSAVQAQKTLQSAQHMLEPFLASSSTQSPTTQSTPAPVEDAEIRARVSAVLAQAYEKEAVLLRQLSKAAEDNRHNRFLFLYQSSLVFEKALSYVLRLQPSLPRRATDAAIWDTVPRLDANNVEALNFLAVNCISQACMIKPSPDQDQYFQKCVSLSCSPPPLTLALRDGAGPMTRTRRWPT
jgi:hypothetical protein